MPESLSTVYGRWYRAEDALISLDHALADVVGAARQSARVADLVKRFRNDIAQEIHHAGEAVGQLRVEP